MNFYAPFCLPFILGAAAMFLTLLWKWGRWLYLLPHADKLRILRGLPTRATLDAVGEVISESLLHRRIFRINPLLGYMHMSLAFGWFLLIAVGWIETIAYLGFRYVPLQGHVFFKYFATNLPHKPVFELTMDLLLLFVLSGVALAWGKRLRSRALGMRRTTKHVPGDRIALTALWFIFPARLIAESTTCALYGGGSFLTGSLGGWMAAHLGTMTLVGLETAAWWFYSSCLGIFFVALPFSRYMHIFTEIPSSSCAATSCARAKRSPPSTGSRRRPARAAASASTPASCRACSTSATYSRSTSCATAATARSGCRRPTTA